MWQPLTHWGRVMHICVVNLTIIGPDNGLSPGRRQAIIWTNAGILLIGPWGTNFSEILIGIQTFSFKKMHLKMSSAKRRPFCLGLNVLKILCPAALRRLATHWFLCYCQVSFLRAIMLHVCHVFCSKSDLYSGFIIVIQHAISDHTLQCNNRSHNVTGLFKNPYKFVYLGAL